MVNYAKQSNALLCIYKLRHLEVESSAVISCAYHPQLDFNSGRARERIAIKFIEGCREVVIDQSTNQSISDTDTTVPLGVGKRSPEEATQELNGHTTLKFFRRHQFYLLKLWLAGSC